MLHITIASHEWLINPLMGEDILSKREFFNIFLINSIAPHLKSYCDCQKIIITFPDIVCKADRYQIHKFGIHNQFDTLSYDTNVGERILEITLSKKYVQDLFKNYEFPVEVESNAEIALKSDKQMLFETIIQFVENNLSDEFKNYLNKI